MPKKKTSKKSVKFLSAKQMVLASAIVPLIIIAALYLFGPLKSDNDDVQVTAPKGTTSRMDQLNASEISGESSADTDYDTQQQSNVQSDSNLLGQVSGTADEN